MTNVFTDRKVIKVSDISTVNGIVTERMVNGKCVCFFVCLLHCINSDKFVLSNESHEMYHTSAHGTELLLRGR